MNEKNYLTENMELLTPDLREAIGKIDYLGNLHKIQRDRKLHIDQAASMEKLTFMLMLGEIDEVQYLSKLSNELGVTPAEAEEIGGEVQGTILEPIIQEFKRIEHSPVAEVETALAETTNQTSIPATPTYQSTDTLKSIPEIVETPVNQNVNISRESILADIEDAVTVVAPTQALTLNTEHGLETLKGGNSVSTTKTEVKDDHVVMTAPITSPPAANIAPTTPTIEATLKNNLTTPVTTKPAKITTSIDPYLEAIE